MLIGNCLFLITDTYFTYSNSINVYLSGGISNLMWMISLMLIGLSSLYSLESSVTNHSDNKDSFEESNLVFIPYILTAILILIILNEYPKAGIVQITVYLTITLFIIRQSINVIENKKLLLKLKVANDELKEVNYIKELDARTDFLTGLNNRRYIDQILEKLLEKGISKSGEYVFSLFIIDLDLFKRINDSYGHEAGDYVLEEIANVMRSNTRSNEVIGRYGGEEFIVILPETSLNEAVQIGERLRIQIEKARFKYKDNNINVTISIGVTQFILETDSSVKKIKHRADEALYLAKSMGRNMVVSK